MKNIYQDLLDAAHELSGICIDAGETDPASSTVPPLRRKQIIAAKKKVDAECAKLLGSNALAASDADEPVNMENVDRYRGIAGLPPEKVAAAALSASAGADGLASINKHRRTAGLPALAN